MTDLAGDQLYPQANLSSVGPFDSIIIPRFWLHFRKSLAELKYI